LTNTASGYLLLLFQDEAGRRSMLASHREVDGELQVNRSQLLTAVRKVARNGYAQLQSRQIAFARWRRIWANVLRTSVATLFA
jgi:DNA-binding IclR family transcriptional regulator